MRHRGVQRAVRSHKIDRSIGDAPSIGRVERLPGTGLAKGERRKRRRGASGRGNRERSKRTLVLLTWLTLFGVIALAVLGWVGYIWVKRNTSNAAASAGGTLEGIRVVSKFESPTQEEALALVKSGLAVREPSKVGEYFRLGTASPEMVVEFLKKLETGAGKVKRMEWLSSMDRNGMLMDGVLLRMTTNGKLDNRLALLTPDIVGHWKIDFDALARTVNPTWSELLEKNAPEGLVRVAVVEDYYYNGLFRDDSQWICIRMVSPDTDVTLLGYCKTGSPQAKAMDRIIFPEVARSVSLGPNRATLKIRKVEGSERRQFEIVRVIAEDWVVSDVAFDEYFE